MKRWLGVFFWFYTVVGLAQNQAPFNASQSFSKYAVSSVKINSSYAEFCPLIYKNNFYFVSNKPTITGVEYSSNDRSTTDIFVCERKTTTLFSKPKKVAELNTTYDNGPVTISSKGNTILFTSSNKAGKLQIYYAVLENGKWGKPLLHPVNRAGSSYCHPVLSDDEKTLLFCSDKEGGFGGMDIYTSRLDGISWSNPKNLGSKINSAANEVFPYLTKDNQLYFSSKRPGGLGELDIYAFNLQDSTNAYSKLLDSPFNSAYDDFGLCFDSTKNEGYFSSNRMGSEGDNIFYFTKTVPDFEGCAKIKPNSCFTFKKDNYSLKNETPESVYEWNLGDGNKIRAKALNHCYSQSGFYTVVLNVVEPVSGKIIYNELTYTIAVSPGGLQINVKDTLYINTPIVFDASGSKIEGYKISSYDWKFNDTAYSKGPKTTYQYFKNGIYLVELSVDAQNLLTNQIKTFCVQKRILVGDKAYVEKNLRYFKYTELQPDAESLYYADSEERGLLVSPKKKSNFAQKELTLDAFRLGEDTLEDILLSEEEEFLRKHKFDLLTSDASSLGKLSEEDAALFEKIKKARQHLYKKLNPDSVSMQNMSDQELFLREKNRLLRFKNGALPPIVDTIYFPKQKEEETVFRVNLGWSDSRVDKKSSIFDGIEKLEESQEGNRFRYTSGKEKDFVAIIPYYENAKQKGFKDAAVIGFVKDNIAIGQAKNLKAILFDSASVESQALKVYFKYNAPLYDTKYNVQLDSLLKKADRLHERKVLLITHFDGLGSLDYNMNLNTQRTNNMINYLVKRGVKRAAIKTEFIIHPTENLAPDFLRRIEVFLQH